MNCRLSLIQMSQSYIETRLVSRQIYLYGELTLELDNSFRLHKGTTVYMFVQNASRLELVCTRHTAN